MCYNEVSAENEIILSIFAEKGPYNMAMWFVVPMIVTDTSVKMPLIFLLVSLSSSPEVLGPVPI